MDGLHWKRGKAIKLNVVLIILLSIPAILGFNVLSGIAPLGSGTNIMDLEGHLDLPDVLLARMDYVIASMHIPCLKSGTAAENTDCLIRVMDNPYVQIIGHPDDSRYPLEYDRLVAAAKEKGVLLEVNNTSLSAGSVREGGRENVETYLKLCKEMKAPVILGTDSHYAPHIGDFSNAREVLKAVGFPEELVVNTSVEKLRGYIRGV